MNVDIVIHIDDPGMRYHKRGDEAEDLTCNMTCDITFDRSCVPWMEDFDKNLMFLRYQEAYANDLLKIRGYLFMNEVYELLGMRKTKAGQMFGWTRDDKELHTVKWMDLIHLNRDDNNIVIRLQKAGFILDELP